MMLARPARLASFFCALCLMSATADVKVQLATSPDLSPDGSSLLFSRYGDIWRVPTKGGRAVRLTTHHASDAQPKYSPDGSMIAFTSDRSGSRQVYVMNARGGEPKQLTFHSEGYALHDWYPDGESLLVSGSRDHHWRGATRFMKISATERSAETVLFNGYGDEGRVSPDGKRIVFVREGERWWRKGYLGARSAQVWTFNIETSEFVKLVDTPAGDRSPAWSADGSHVYYCSSDGAKNGARNLWQCELASGLCEQLTEFDDDLVATPTVSADGSTIVFSHLFDLYRYAPGKDAGPKKIGIRIRRDDLPADLHRRTLSSASDVTFSKDGLEMAFVAGGDVWVMENELKEPVQITSTSEFESDPLFIDDGNALLFVGWKDGQADIWKAERSDDSKYWWQTSDFKMTQITNDSEIESDLTLSPNGHELIYARGRGDLWARDLKSGKDWMLVDAFSGIDYDVSPDGKWIVYSQTDDNFNNDIWIVPVDKSSAAVNVSRHPDDEYGPKWSSDGRMIAFTGRRSDDEIDIYYMYLTEEDDDDGSRDRRLKKTLDAFKKARKSAAKPAAAAAKADKPTSDKAATDKPADKPKTADETKVAAAKPPAAQPEKPAKKLPEVKIDFKDLHRRLRRISIPNSSERLLGWSPDGKKLLFAGSVGGSSGTWYVSFPSELTPKKITSSVGSIKGWMKSPDRMLWLVNGVPGYQPLSGSGKTYSFNAYQQLSQADRYRAGFETAWRVMRDAWYDENYGNHNWDEIRRKYVDAAANSGDRGGLSLVMSLMLGELNGSHLGFYSRSDLGPAMSGGDDWRPTTAHLGVRFVDDFKGPGLKVKDVIPNGPAMDADSMIHAGEIIVSIDGTPVDPAMDLTTVLNGRSSRDIHMVVKSADKEAKERDVILRPTSYGAARAALYQKWQDDNRAMVAKQADNIGYLHIQGMNWPSFLEFERELYDIGYGKDGLIIDVRDNGGGSTTDHLLTALTQPQHAITVPRGGGKGYPQSRMVYATWNKPIVVMCNQNSYSNAEIFSHAIKNLGRGKLVGVPTAGGVISTGSARVMDVGTVRLPFRGWYLSTDGEDMELNGAVPDVIVWPQPTELPNGIDHQLEKAVEVLQADIKAWKETPSPTLRKATER